MDIDLKSHRAHITYHQALNWHEAKIQRHLLARGDDRETMLGLALALLSHRLAFFDTNKTAPVRVDNGIFQNRNVFEQLVDD